MGKEQQRPHQNRPLDPETPAATTEPPRERDDPQAVADARAQRRRDVARHINVPPVGPRARQGTDDDDEQPGRAPVRSRIEGRRPLRGIGAPQSKEHDSLVQDAHRLMETYKADPEAVDSTLVLLMHLQAIVSYGGEFSGLKNEIARLRREVEAYRTSGSGEDPSTPPLIRSTARAARLQRGVERRTGASRLRGRGRTG